MVSLSRIFRRKFRFLQRPSKVSAKRFRSPLSILAFFRFLIILFVLLAIFFFVFKSDVFKVNNISVLFEGYGYDSESIKDRINSAFIGKNIFWLNEGGVSSALKKEYLSIVSTRLIRNLPRSVLFYVSQRDPVAMIVPVAPDFQSSPSAVISMAVKEGSSPSQRLLIDKSGLLFYEASVSGMTIIVTDGGNATLGNLMSKSSDKFMIKTVSQMKTADVPASLITGIYGDVLVVLKDKSFAWLTPTKEVDYQVEILKMIIEKYRIEGKGIAKIDLRFKNPVVEFK